MGSIASPPSETTTRKTLTNAQICFKNFRPENFSSNPRMYRPKHIQPLSVSGTYIVDTEKIISTELVIKNIHVSVQSLHATYKDHKQVGEIELPFLKYESNGTIRMLRVLPAIFEALDAGSTLFIDEIENGLHPNLVKLLAGLFNSNESNPHHAQLICTTHDTLLLDGVRRDQVWFTDKNQYGETSMCRLSDYPNVRSNDNIAAKYLQGVFGAIPNTQNL